MNDYIVYIPSGRNIYTFILVNYAQMEGGIILLTCLVVYVWREYVGCVGM